MKTASLTKYTEVAAITIRSRLAYLWDLVGSCLFLGIVMFVLIELWKHTFKTQGANIAGFSLAQMVWYLVAAETIIMAMPPIHRTIEREIRDGDVAIRLGKPYSYLMFHASVFISEAATKSFLLLFVAGLTTLLMVGPLPFDPRSLPALLVTYLLTWSIHFSYSSMIGLAAFWMEDITGLFFIMDRFKWLIGGFLLPISVFPEPLKTIAEHMPFRYMIYEPARLVVDFSWNRWLEVSCAQVLTAILFGVVSRATYRFGVRKLNLNGG